MVQCELTSEDLKKAEIVLGDGVVAVGLIRGAVAQSRP